MRDFLRRIFRQLRPFRSRESADLAYRQHVFGEIAKHISQVFWADNYRKSVSILNIGNYSELFGRPVENLQRNNLDWLEAVHPEDRARVEAALPRQLTGRFDETYRVIHPDGAVKWLHDRAFLIDDSNGRSKLRAGIVEDVTLQAAFEEQLRHDHKIRAMGLIAGGISHDFNNILAIIQGNLELAQLDLSSPNASGYLKTALDATTRGASLTHRLLAYARRQPLNPIAIDPHKLLHGLDNLLNSSMGGNIAVEIVAPGDLWKCHADERQLETVMVNLAINARDAMPDGGTLTLEASNFTLVDATEHALPPGDYICFTMTDTGVGMPPEIVAQAFDPFFTTKGPGAGTGLGLAMAHGFVKQSGGLIRIDSTPGRGTSVKIYLPRDAGGAKPGPYASQPPEGAVLKGQRVLVAEDEAEVRAVVAAHLLSFGCIVTDVATASEALVLCRSQQAFDLLLTDLVLPGHMNGLALANLVRSCVPGIAVVYMTGYAGEIEVNSGNPAEITLQKPFSRAEIFAALVQALERKTRA